MSEHYEEVAQDELAKLENYRVIYEATHPYPEKKEVSFMQELGMEAVMLVSSAVGSIILSAIRTSTIFMLTEALLIATFDQENIIPIQITKAFPIASMIVSLVAFEGYLSAHGFIEGKNSEKISVSPVAMWLCFGVTIMAGLSASFGLIGVSTENMSFQIISWVLAVLTAIGAPVVAYYGSLNLGVISNQWNKIRQDLEDAYLDGVRSWNNAFLSSYSGKRSQRLFADRSQRTNDGDQSFSESFDTPTNDGIFDERREQIIDILENTTNGEVLGTSEIAKILAGQVNGNPENITGYENFKGYIHRIRREWMTQRGYA